MARTANPSKRGSLKAAARAGSTPGGAGGNRQVAPALFPIPDRFTRSGHVVGDICFECECRILEISGPENLLLAWCECRYPDDHADLEIL